jgi:hypothetical protein
MVNIDQIMMNSIKTQFFTHMMQSETVYPTPPRQTIFDCRKFAETIKPSRQITQPIYALPPST